MKNVIVFSNVTVNAAIVFFKILHHFFDSVLGTFHYFYKLNYTFVLVFDFDKFNSQTSCL